VSSADPSNFVTDIVYSEELLLAPGMYAALLARKGGAAAAAQGVAAAAAAAAAASNDTNKGTDIVNDLEVSSGAGSAQSDALASPALAKDQSSDSDTKKVSEAADLKPSVVIDYNKYDPNWKQAAQPKKSLLGEFAAQKRKDDDGEPDAEMPPPKMQRKDEEKVPLGVQNMLESKKTEDKSLCILFQKGQCKNNFCRFKHELSLSEPEIKVVEDIKEAGNPLKKPLNPDGTFGDPRPKHQSSGKIPKGWTCPNVDCGRNNFQWRPKCPNCGALKPKENSETPLNVPSNEPVTGVNNATKKPEANNPSKKPEPLLGEPMKGWSSEVNTSRMNNSPGMGAKHSRFDAPNGRSPKPAAAPPREVPRGDNPNLVGLGTRKGFGNKSNNGSSGSETMAEKLARLAGMTNVPIGFGKKEDSVKSWSDVKGTSEPPKDKGTPEFGGNKSGEGSIVDLEEEFLGKKEAESGLGRGNMGGSIRGGRGGGMRGGRFNDSSREEDMDLPMGGSERGGFGSFMSGGMRGSMRGGRGGQMDGFGNNFGMEGSMRGGRGMMGSNMRGMGGFQRGGMGMDGPMRGGMGMDGPMRGGMGMDGPMRGGMDMDGPMRGGMGMDGPMRGGMGMDGPMRGGRGMGMDGPMRGGRGMGMDGPMRGGRGMGMDGPMRGGRGMGFMRGGGGMDMDGGMEMEGGLMRGGMGGARGRGGFGRGGASNDSIPSLIDMSINKPSGYEESDDIKEEFNKFKPEPGNDQRAAFMNKHMNPDTSRKDFPERGISQLPSSANVKPGDWMCPNPSCANHNFSWRQECKMCGAPKPSDGKTYSADQASEFKKSDWICSNFLCKNNNFGWRQRCQKCEEPKPDNPVLASEIDDDDKPVCKDFQTGKCSRHNCKFSHDIKKLQICGDFQFGKCNREKCRFAHVKDPNKQSNEICGDYQFGKCNRENCRFTHVFKDDDEGKEACKDFQLGRCSRERCRFRHVTESELHKEQMQRSQNQNMMEGGMISYPTMGSQSRTRNFSGNKGPAGWDAYKTPITAQHNAFTPIWPAVPAQERKVSQAKPEGSNFGGYDMASRPDLNFSAQGSSSGFSSTKAPSSAQQASVSPGMKLILDKVTEATTPLSSIPYPEQATKKTKEAKWVAQQLGNEIVTANPATKNWIEFQTQKYGYLSRIDKLKESPILDGYRNKCEFAIGTNPETRRLTVGFKLDPRSGSSDVGPVDHLKHVPPQMKFVVKQLEIYLRNTPYKHFDYQTGEGSWVSAIVRITQRQETMVILNFVAQSLSSVELNGVKNKLRQNFEFGDGAQCNITSLYFSEKSRTGPGTLDNLYGSDTISEALFGLEFLISPRAYFCINTHGAEILVETIAELAGLHKNLTLLDVCCGTGAIGLSLARRCGMVLGVDILPEAVEDAKKNSKINRIDNANFLSGPAEDLIPQMIQQAIHEEIVAIIDPPRAGIAMKAIRQIRASRIKKIIFVSSDPRTTIKNFVDLSRPSSATFFGDPFMPVVIQPVDLFPHTTHYMTLFLFMRVSQADLLYPHRANMEAYYGSLPAYSGNFDLDKSSEENHTSRRSTSAESSAPSGYYTGYTNYSTTESQPAGSARESSLSEEQRSWLQQMVQTYGPTFEREKWVQTFIEQNHEAALKSGASVPAPRPPSPQIPPMPAFPVAPTSQDPAAYAKYKADYDAYSSWYNTYGVLYAAKQEAKAKGNDTQKSPSGQKLPDPNAVPPGTDPVAWRKYCNDTREYYAKYKNPVNMAQEQTVSNPQDSQRAMAQRIADKILNKRGLGGQ